MIEISCTLSFSCTSNSLAKLSNIVIIDYFLNIKDYIFTETKYEKMSIFEKIHFSGN